VATPLSERPSTPLPLTKFGRRFSFNRKLLAQLERSNVDKYIMHCSIDLLPADYFTIPK